MTSELSIADSRPEPFYPDDLFAIVRERMGWSDEALADLNDPSYPPLKDLDHMVAELHRIRLAAEPLTILPDFDMDGISSGVLGYAGFAELGFDVELYVPDYNRGHDIAPEAVDELLARHPRTRAIITCDGGVKSHPGISRGALRGVTMLVTDHHLELPTEPDGSAVRSAHVVVDPARIDETCPHEGICGAFVLYQVLMAYAQAHAPDKIGAISSPMRTRGHRQPKDRAAEGPSHRAQSRRDAA